MLSMVTITGADDSVDFHALADLSREFPFVEWGILMSESSAGTPRYPSRRWMIGLENTAKDAFRLLSVRMNIAAHFCGAVARDALAGNLHDFPVIERVQRVQVNGYAPPSPGIVAFAQRMPCYEIILQVREESWLQAAANDAVATDRMSLLYDPSGGRGMQPFRWPRAPLSAFGRMGYAGGIHPANVVETIQAIYESNLSITGRFWIDMESGVRDEQDCFDLGKVRAVLETTAPMIRRDDWGEK